MGMIRVKGYPSLFRDEETGAIINCDTSGYNNYIENRNLKETQRLTQKNEIEQLKSEVTEIKSLLRELINETRRNSN